MLSRPPHLKDPGVARGMLAAGVALAATAVLPAALAAKFPLAPFAAAVCLACHWGGRSAGLVATALGAFALPAAWILPPVSSLVDAQALGLAFFIAASVTYCTLTKSTPFTPAIEADGQKRILLFQPIRTDSRRIAA